MLKPAQVKELLLQSLGHEKGAVLVYETALECARNPDLRKEWTKYHGQTQHHDTRRDKNKCNRAARIRHI